MSMVYLLHLDPPFGHAKHYLGFTEGDLEGRLRYHFRGRGSRLLRAAVDAGCTPVITRLWRNADRNDERRLKRHSSGRYCPVCSDPDVTGGCFEPVWLRKKLLTSNNT